MTNITGVNEWNTFYKDPGHVYPDETLVRLLRGQYADVPKSGRVLDVGFDTGASVIMFAHCTWP